MVKPSALTHGISKGSGILGNSSYKIKLLGRSGTCSCRTGIVVTALSSEGIGSYLYIIVIEIYIL